MKRKIFSILFALVLVLSLSLIPAVSVMAQTTWYVDDDNCPGPGSGIQTDPFCSIQAAIDAAIPGDTINVAAGTYTEYLHITTDGLTIEGAGIDQSIIDLDGLIPYWHYAGCSRSFASRAGVLITGYGSTDELGNPDEVVEGVTFKGFTVQNAGLNPPITATGTHTGLDDAAILTDSTASWTPGALVNQWVHNVSDKLIKIDITGNTPIRSYGEITANTATTVTATLAGGLDNNWDNGDTYVIMPYEEYVDVAEDLQDDVRGIGIGNGKDISILYCKVINSGYGGITVGYARCVSTHLYSEGVTIDHCIVSDHPVVGISVGSYIGSVTITNNVCSNNKSPHPTDPTREYVGKGIEVTGKDATLSGLISGNICNDNGFEGIVLKNYSDGVIIENNTVTGSNFDEDGAGIFFYGKSSNPANCKNNIIRSNTVTGNIRGIVAYYAQACTIEGNTITTDSGDFDSGQAAIKIDGGNNITVKDNIISCDGVGIKVQKTWDDVDCYNNTFTGNTITGAKFAGVFISHGAHDNTFECNTITGTTTLTRWAGKDYEQTQGDGVFLWGYTGKEAGTGNVFHYNRIYANAGDGMENQVTTTTVDAEYNWWGDSSGPYHPATNPSGTGDAVSAYLDYDPWMMRADYTGETLFSVDEDVVLEAIFRDSNGNALPCGDVDFYIDDVLDYSVTPDAMGFAIKDIGTLPVDVYEVYAKTCCLKTDTVLVAVYDPSAGFVTGGGWIMSPAGAYTANPELEGKATFGFVSRYKKGAVVPTGNTQFNFRVADLNFHSDCYDWLVVAGDTAKFKGWGTINGAGEYRFMLWAGDGDPDTFRIKIWTEDNSVETVIYDNGSHQPIGGGNIVVHKSKK